MRRKNKLCLWCGKPLDRDGALCTACARKSNERTKAYKDYYLRIGVCPVCRKRKVTPGYKSCYPCREKISLRKKKIYSDPIKKEQRLQARKEKRAKLVEEGICTNCGKNKAEKGFRTCPDCRKKAKNYRKLYVTKYQLSDRALWVSQGRCERCGNDDLQEGTKLCKKCYAHSLAALEKGRAVVIQHRAEERAKQEAIEAQKMQEVKKMFHPRSIWERRNTENKQGENNK